MTASVDAVWERATDRAEFLEVWAPTEWIAAGSRAGFETMMRYDIAALSALEAPVHVDPPSDRATAFVYWLTRRFGEDEDTCLPELVDALTASDDTATGAADALMIVPPGDDSAIEGRAAWDNAYARRVFLEAAAGQPGAVSDALLNTALETDAATRAAALAAEAPNPQRGADYFQPWYQADSGESALAAGCQAVFAGMMRGDPAADEAVAGLVDQADGDDALHQAMTLIALRGLASQQRTLERYAERAPRAGAELIGVYGYPDLLPTLHELMSTPAAAETAATAWWRITGASVPRQARLASVDGAADQAKGEMPDAEWAAGWLDEYRRDFPTGQRRLFARPVDAGSLATACRGWAGAASRYLVWQAQLAAGTSAALQSAQWIEQRRRRLEAAGLRDEVEVPPEVHTADPWEYGHYA